MKQIKLYYVVSDVFGEMLIPNAMGDLNEAISCVENDWANSGDMKIIERLYTLQETREHIVNTDY